MRPAHQQTTCRRQSGFTLIEMLFAFVLYSILLASVYGLLSSGSKQTVAASAASQLKTIIPAVEAYVTANYSTLETSATATTAVTVPISTLTAGAYLPANYSAINPYNETYTVYILQPTAGNLMALTLASGGYTYPGTPNNNDKQFVDRTIPNAAAMAGASAGYVSTNDITGYTLNQIRGSYGGWSVSTTGTNIPNPGPGHLALMQYFSQGTLASDYLYRFAVPGQSQLNEMFTDLNMGGNSIGSVKNIAATNTIAASGIDPTTAPATGVSNGLWGFDVYASDSVYVGGAGGTPTVAITGSNGNVSANGEVSAENGNVLLSHAVTYQTQVSNGSLVPIPTYCPAGSTPQIQLSISNASEGATAYPMSSQESWATVSGSSWLVHLRVLTQDGWVSPAAPFLTGTASVNCD